MERRPTTADGRHTCICQKDAESMDFNRILHSYPTSTGGIYSLITSQLQHVGITQLLRPFQSVSYLLPGGMAALAE